MRIGQVFVLALGVLFFSFGSATIQAPAGTVVIDQHVKDLNYLCCLRNGKICRRKGNRKAVRSSENGSKYRKRLYTLVQKICSGKFKECNRRVCKDYKWYFDE